MRGDEPKRLHLLWKHLNSLDRKDLPDTVGSLKHLYERLVRLYGIYEYAPNGYLRLDRQGRILGCNKTFCTMVGVARVLLLDRNCFDFVIHQYREELAGQLQEAFEQGAAAFCELQLMTLDGQRWFRFDIDQDLMPEDRPTVRVTVNDIADRKAREQQFKEIDEQLQMAAQAAELGVWNYDPSSQTFRWNAQLYRLLGLEPQPGPEEEDRFFEFIHPEDRTGILASNQAMLDKPGDEINEEFRIIRKDGQIRWLTARGRIYRDTRGQVLHVSGINYDITERKQSEESVQTAQLQLAAQLSETKRVNEELSQYAYVVSHDLKGPLRALHNYADFLYEDLAESLTGDQKAYLEGMKQAARQGNTLIDDLLNFSRLERIAQEITTADVPDVVKEIQSILNPAPDVQISVEPQWPDISVDRTLLKQILQNLIANGIKFNTRTPKHIDIGWQSTRDGSIEIAVRDNGIGIEPRYWDQIFKIFQRLHKLWEYEGTGIGLAIVQKAAHMMGGSVRLTSRPGSGSTFYIKLPWR